MLYGGGADDTLLLRRRAMMGGGEEQPVFVDWIAGDGLAWIDTGYVLPRVCSIRSKSVGYETQKRGQGIWGVKESNAVTYVILGGGTNSSRRQMVPAYRSNGYLLDQALLPFTYQSYSLFQTPDGFGWGNAFTPYISGSEIIHDTFKIFAPKNDLAFTGKMHAVEIFGSETRSLKKYNDFDSYSPITTFRPCYYNGQYGIWYMEGNRFCGNSAEEGTITGGND